MARINTWRDDAVVYLGIVDDAASVNTAVALTPEEAIAVAGNLMQRAVSAARGQGEIDTDAPAANGRSQLILPPSGLALP